MRIFIFADAFRKISLLESQHPRENSITTSAVISALLLFSSFLVQFFKANHADSAGVSWQTRRFGTIRVSRKATANYSERAIL